MSHGGENGGASALKTLRAVCCYVVVVMASGIIMGHVYYCHTETPYWRMSTGYEKVGSVIIITLLSCAYAGVLAVVGSVWHWLRPASSYRCVVANAAMSSIVYAALLIWGVFRRIPLDRWDRQWAGFYALVFAAAICAQIAGHVFACALSRMDRPFRRGKGKGA